MREIRLSGSGEGAVLSRPYLINQNTCFFSAKRSFSSMSERAGSFFGDFSCFKFWLHSKSDRLLD